MTTRLSDIKDMDVINLIDGKILGSIADIVVDFDSGKINAIVVSENVFTLWSKSKNYTIPWSRIKKIGVDTILIENEIIYDG